jgi:hypothetical protein
MTFDPKKFASMGGTLSEKLATVFNSIGATQDGVATTGDKGRLMGSGSMALTLANADTTTSVPLQINRTFTLMGADNTGGAAYFKAITGAALAGQLATVMVRTTIGHNLFDAYGLQSHLTFGHDADISTTDANAHLTAISGKVTFDTSTVTKGWVNAGLFIVEGAGTCSQLCYGVSIVEEAGSTGCQALLHLNTDVGVIPALKINSTSATGGTVYEATDTHQTFVGSIKINVNGTDRYLHYCDAQAATS